MYLRTSYGSDLMCFFQSIKDLVVLLIKDPGVQVNPFNMLCFPCLFYLGNLNIYLQSSSSFLITQNLVVHGILHLLYMYISNENIFVRCKSDGFRLASLKCCSISHIHITDRAEPVYNCINTALQFASRCELYY